jgi:hypothetical protein
MNVAAHQAGTNLECRCGRTVPVPPLSKLRTLSGHGAYESGIIDTINRMVRDGELPYGELCAVSGFPTSDVCNLCVQCESKWIKRAGSDRYFMMFVGLVLAPFFLLPFLLRVARNEQTELHGRERRVYIPLRVRSDFHEQLRRTRNQRTLRAWLRSVPVYAELLDQYPQAKVYTN